MTLPPQQSNWAFLLTMAGLLVFGAETNAGGWIQPKGKLWLKSSLLYQATDTRFCTVRDARAPAFQQIGCTAAGHRTAFDPFVGGELRAAAVFTDIFLGLTSYLEAGLQVPFHRIEFSNLADPGREPASGLGDIRFHLKLQTSRAPLVSSLRLAVKAPGGFNRDAEITNISEGQWDLELFAEFSRFLSMIPLYLSLGAGYRLREDNADFEHSLGNELIGQLEGGFRFSNSILLKGSLDWLRGDRPVLFATGLAEQWRRELLTTAASLILPLSQALSLETGARFSLSGEDFPAGTQYHIGIAFTFFPFSQGGPSL